MKNMKFWRTALVAALVLTVMLSVTGGTIAWFTDEVTSNENIIKSGTLDVEMYWAKGTEAVPAGDNGWTDASTGKIFDYDKWEPGYVDVRHFKIANKGNLAFIYSLKIETADTVSKLADVIDVYFIDEAQQVTSRAALAGIEPVGTLTQVLAGMPINTAALLKEKESDTVTIALKMQESANNDYQNLSIGTEGFSVKLEAVQATVEEDSFDNMYDDAATAAYVKAAQDALDNAKKGDVIQLVPGVNYGTLTFRRNADSKVVDIGDIGGDAAGNEKYSRYEDITILGAEGATVDQITFQNGREKENAIWNYIDVKNLTIKNVTFTGEDIAVKISDGFDIAIDGLSLIDCKMSDADGADRFVYQPRSGYESINDKKTGKYVMTTGVKNLTITGCEVIGAHQVIEARPMENITITNNTFKGIKARDILLGATSDSYAGTIDISGNKSIGGQERFVRGSGIGNATLVITNNIITDYAGEDDNYINVEGANGTTTVNGNSATAVDATRTLTVTVNGNVISQ